MIDGLGYLDFHTRLTADKTLTRVTATALGRPLTGYEMHVGVSEGEGLSRPFLHIDGGQADGAVSADGRTASCYIHGLFASDAFRRAWLKALERGQVVPAEGAFPSPQPNPLADLAPLSGKLQRRACRERGQRCGLVYPCLRGRDRRHAG